MAKTLTYELSDEVAAALTEMSVQSGTPFEELALQWLLKYRARAAASPREQGADSLEKLRAYAGAAVVGHLTGIVAE